MANKTKKKSNNAKNTNPKDNIQKTQAAEPKKTAVAKDEKKAETKKTSQKADKKKKPNIFVRAVDFVKGVVTELKKVNWLSREDLMKSSGFVAGFVAVFTLLVWVVDSGLGALAALFIGMK